MVTNSSKAIACGLGVLILVLGCGRRVQHEHSFPGTPSGHLLDSLSAQLDTMLSELALGRSLVHPNCLLVLYRDSVHFGLDSLRTRMQLFRPLTRSENTQLLVNFTHTDLKGMDALLGELDLHGLSSFEYINTLGAHVFQVGRASNYYNDLFLASLSEYDLATDSLDRMWKLERVQNECVYLTRRF